MVSPKSGFAPGDFVGSGRSPPQGTGRLSASAGCRSSPACPGVRVESQPGSARGRTPGWRGIWAVALLGCWTAKAWICRQSHRIVAVERQVVSFCRPEASPPAPTELWSPRSIGRHHERRGLLRSRSRSSRRSARHSRSAGTATSWRTNCSIRASRDTCTMPRWRAARSNSHRPTVRGPERRAPQPGREPRPDECRHAC